MKNRRSLGRKDIEPLEVVGLISIHDINPIADEATLTEASSSGFRLVVPRQKLASKDLRGGMTLDQIVGMEISLHIPAMDLDITGSVVRTRYLGDGLFEVGIDYTDDAPAYWRECLCDLLPAPGELAS